MFLLLWFNQSVPIFVFDSVYKFDTKFSLEAGIRKIIEWAVGKTFSWKFG